MSAGLEQEILCVVWFSVSIFVHGLMERLFTLPANLSLFFGNPLDCEQKSGPGPESMSATWVHRACAWAWRAQVLRESETILEVQRAAGYMNALEVCCYHCWLSFGEEGNMFFLFRIAYQAVGGGKKLLWRRGKSLGCQDRSTSCRYFPVELPKSRCGWMMMKLCITYDTWNFIQLLQQFADNITPAEEWIRQKVKVGRCSYTTTLKPFLQMWDSPLRVYSQQLQQKMKNSVSDLAGGQRIPWASEIRVPWDQWVGEVRVLVCSSLKVCSLYPGTSSRPSPRALVCSASSGNISPISWSVWVFLWDLSFNPALTWTDPA